MPRRISVVVPVYNARTYLTESVTSVLAQSESDFELLIVDDGSDDGSPELVQTLARSDARIRLIKQEHGGITRALNTGLQVATGELIARMDADDICLPDRFRRQVEYLCQHPDVFAVGSFVERIDSEGMPIAVGKWPVEHREIDAMLMQGRGGLPHPTAMIRREPLMRLGGYREEYPVAQDKDLWLRIAEVGQLANIPEPLLCYREHLRSVSSVRQAEQVDAVRRAVIDAGRRRSIEIPKEQVASRLRVRTEFDRRRQWIKLAMRHGNVPTAIKHASHLLRAQPTSWQTWLTLMRFAGHPRALATALRGSG